MLYVISIKPVFTSILQSAFLINIILSNGLIIAEAGYLSLLKKVKRIFP
jgi:hypothetical protein